MYLGMYATGLYMSRYARADMLGANEAMELQGRHSLVQAGTLNARLLAVHASVPHPHWPPGYDTHRAPARSATGGWWGRA